MGFWFWGCFYFCWNSQVRVQKRHKMIECINKVRCGSHGWQQMSWTACLACMKSQTAEWQTNSRDIALWKLSVSTLPWFLGWWKPTPWNDKTVCQQQELLLFLSLKLLFHLYTTGAIWRVTARGKWHQTRHNHTSYLYPSVIALDETCSRQHSHTCDGQTILSVSSSSGGGEERSSSPDIKLSYLFTASQMMPDNRNISLGPV